MQRRTFIGLTFSTFAGAAISPNFSFAKALEESSQNLSGHKTEYDIVVKSGTLGGIFAALSAAKRGLKVLLLESRTYLGTDITASRRLWLGAEGYDELKSTLGDVFFPSAEKNSFARDLNENRAKGDNECLLMAGSIKKGLLRSAVKAGVDVMLMADACGMLRGADNDVAGVIVALKQGLFAAKCSAFIDASENSTFSRTISGEKLNIEKCRYVIEIENSGVQKSRRVDAGDELNGFASSLTLHCNKRGDDRAFVEFEFYPESNDINKIEQQARNAACRVSKFLAKIPETKTARTNWIADNVSLKIKPSPVSIRYKNYFVLENPFKELSCADICEIAEKAEKISAGINGGKTPSKPVAALVAGKEQKFEADLKTNAEECGKKLPLYPVNPSIFDLPRQDSEILIAGCGTAGNEAAKSALGKSADVAVVEYFNNPGGTKVSGGVMGYYWGIKEHEHIKKIEKEISEFSRNYKMSAITAKTLSSELKILSLGGKMFTEAIICAAETDKTNSRGNRKLTGVYASIRGVLTKFTPKITVDATADADVAFFAGEKFSLGDSRMGITQNYSQWPMILYQKNAPKKFGDMTTKDLDLLDTTSILEFQRGLIISHYESNFYDMYPLLSARQSRLPMSEHTLTVAEALNSHPFKDTVAQAYSDFDPHHFSPSEISRCALLLPHFTNSRRVNIPYGSLVPKNIDGLIFSGRGIGASHLAFQFTRMSADVETLGFVCGEIAAECIKSGELPRDLNVSEVQKSLVSKNYLPEKISEYTPPTPKEIAGKLSLNDSSLLLDACICDPGKILNEILNAYGKSPVPALARALCWHGSEAGHKTVLEQLRKNFAELKKNPQPKDYTEVYTRGNLQSPYWQVCADIAFLAMPCKKLGENEILEILKTTDSGGEMTRQKNPYYANRIDLCLVPNFNLLFNLAFYAERNPSPKFAKEFERILKDPNLSSRKSSTAESARWNAFQANLAIALAAAGARCGSRESAEVLADYVDDIHIFFRRFANSELCCIYKTDANFDKSRWMEIISSKEIPRETPLEKKAEI